MMLTAARYLEREKLVDYPSSRISLLRPTMVLMLMQTPDPRNLRDVLPQLMQCTHIFLPINDAHDAGVADGGTHWSLLVASVIDGTAFHYDSMSPTNYAYGAHACKQLSIFLNRRFEYMNLPESPKQYNSSDCGVFVCMTMEHLLLRRLLNVNSKEKVTMSMRNFEIRASVCRKEMLRVIDGFRAEGEKKRS